MFFFSIFLLIVCCISLISPFVVLFFEIFYPNFQISNIILWLKNKLKNKKHECEQKCEHDYIILEEIEIREIYNNIKKQIKYKIKKDDFYYYIGENYNSKYYEKLSSNCISYLLRNNIIINNKICKKCKHENFKIDLISSIIKESMEKYIENKYEKEIKEKQKIIDKKNIKDIINYRERLNDKMDFYDIEKYVKDQDNLIKANKELNNYLGIKE